MNTRPRPSGPLLSMLLALAGMTHASVARPAGGTPLVSIPDAALPRPLTFIAYGDMRFTDATERDASSPTVRRALVERIAGEHPAALFITGDVPWHGGARADYAVFRDETEAWRSASLRVFPALGNHEFAGCPEADCLENWWTTFPEMRGRRWYSVALGSRIRALALDSDASLLPAAPQREWLETELGNLPRPVEFVLIFLHHPPIADPATAALANHNPRPNEVSLAEYLGRVAPVSRARFLVVAGHIHNYERFEQGGVSYFVSGGGGAHPYPVERAALDRYQGTDFPNFHYLRFRLDGRRLVGEMVRVEDPEADPPVRFAVRDRFEVVAR
jgi:hypothetical protein